MILIRLNRAFQYCPVILIIPLINAVGRNRLRQQPRLPARPTQHHLAIAASPRHHLNLIQKPKQAASAIVPPCHDSASTTTPKSSRRCSRTSRSCRSPPTPTSANSNCPLSRGRSWPLRARSSMRPSLGLRMRVAVNRRRRRRRWWPSRIWIGCWGFLGRSNLMSC